MESKRILPKASVTIVSANHLHDLKRCLPSIFRQHYPDYEVLVVDNASTDGSVEYLAREFPQTKVIRTGANLGYGGGNNVGFRHASGDYIAILNPDTRVEPDWLRELVIALQADLRAGLATPKILMMDDPTRVNACGNEVHITGLTQCRGMGRDRGALPDLVEVSAVSGAAFVIRRDLFETLDGFDEAFFMYMEDTDLSWRARLAGYKCLYVPSSVVYHDYTLRFGPEKTFYQERNRYLLLLKGLRWWTLLVLLPALIVAEVVTWGFVLLRERQRLANKLRAYAWIVQRWDKVMESRRRTQALRRVRDRDLIARCTHRLAYEQTGSGLIVALAHVVFDPLFFVLHRLALTLVWW